MNEAKAEEGGLLLPNVLRPEWTILLEGVIKAIRDGNKDRAEILMGQMARQAFRAQRDLTRAECQKRVERIFGELEETTYTDWNKDLFIEIDTRVWQAVKKKERVN